MKQILNILSTIVAVGGIVLTPIVLIAVWAPGLGLVALLSLKEVIISYFVLAVLFAVLSLCGHVRSSLQE